MIANYSQSQICSTASTHTTIRYISTRRDRVIKTLCITDNKKYLKKEDEENASFLTDKKAFDSLSNFIITNNSNNFDFKMAAKKENSFEICLYNNDLCRLKYYIFENQSELFFKSIVMLFKRSKLDENIIKLF